MCEISDLSLFTFVIECDLVEQVDVGLMIAGYGREYCTLVVSRRYY